MQTILLFQTFASNNNDVDGTYPNNDFDVERHPRIGKRNILRSCLTTDSISNKMKSTLRK